MHPDPPSYLRCTDDNCELVETAATTRGSMRGTKEDVRGRRRRRRSSTAERDTEKEKEEKDTICLILVPIFPKTITLGKFDLMAQ